ncbi:MAG: thiamine-phosphate pyrophosphorylase [Elusimicrobiota bacterium]
MPAKTYRLIDANLNRVREGLRVVEDTLRFVLSNNEQAAKLKRIRHQLDKKAGAIYPQLILARSVEEDKNSGLAEAGRKNLISLLIANFRRAEEGLRVLEEYGKLISAGAGDDFKKLRFQVYQIEKEVMELAVVKQ